MAKPKYASCMICRERIEHVRITKHIGACIRRTGMGRRDDTLALNSTTDKGHLIHVRLMSEEPSENYYLHMLATPDLSLTELDSLVRRTWMEPCSDSRHDSRFSKGDIVLTTSERLNHQEEPMAGASLRYLWARPGGFATYQYDFNLPVTCRLDDFGAYRIDEGHADILLVARNEPAEEQFRSCRGPATLAHCYSSRRNLATKTEFLCDKCRAGDSDPWFPLVNSPRTGACGFRETRGEYAVSPDR